MLLRNSHQGTVSAGRIREEGSISFSENISTTLLASRGHTSSDDPEGFLPSDILRKSGLGLLLPVDSGSILINNPGNCRLGKSDSNDSPLKEIRSWRMTNTTSITPRREGDAPGSLIGSSAFEPLLFDRLPEREPGRAEHASHRSSENVERQDCARHDQYRKEDCQ